MGGQTEAVGAGLTVIRGRGGGGLQPPLQVQAIFGHQIGHKTGCMAQNNTQLVLDAVHLLCGRFELHGGRL